jgi:hypothetical protein
MREPKMRTTAHRLIGKVLYFDHGEHYTLSEFIAYIGDGYLLACRINPNTGEDPGFRSEAQPLKKSGFEHPFQARQSRLGMAS